MIPDSAPFAEAIEDVSRGNPKLPQSQFREHGAIPVIDQGQQLIAGYSNDESLLCRVPAPVVLFGDHTRVFKYVDFPFVIGADGVKVLRARKGWDPKYVFHYLHWRGVPSAGYSRHFKFLRELEVPRQPLDEQRRIAAILDQADAIRAKRRQALAHLDEIIPSVFVAMFGVEARQSVSPSPKPANAQGWNWVLLSEVAELATGHTPDRKKPEYWDGSIPWISLPEIRRLDGLTAQDTDLKITSAGVANSSAVVLPEATVCFSRTASIGFVTKLGRPMATSQDFHNWIPGKYVNADYLMTALRVSRPHLLGASDGSTHKTIYQRTASTFRLLLPPIELQDKFADLLGSIRAQRATLQSAGEAADELFASLQSKAFRGHL